MLVPMAASCALDKALTCGCCKAAIPVEVSQASSVLMAASCVVLRPATLVPRSGVSRFSARALT